MVARSSSADDSSMGPLPAHRSARVNRQAGEVAVLLLTREPDHRSNMVIGVRGTRMTTVSRTSRGDAMCGIAGEIVTDHAGRPDLGAVERMTRTMWSRGPDGAGHWSEGR